MQENKSYPLAIRMGSEKVEQAVMTAVFAALMMPAWLGTFAMIGTLYFLVQLGVFLALLMLTSVSRISRTNVLVLAIGVLFMGSSLIQGESLSATARKVIPYLGTVMACELWINGGRSRQMLRALERLLMAYAWINLATVLLFPDGLYTAVTSDGVSVVKCWFLGYKNPQIRTLLPMLIIMAVIKWNGRDRVISVKFVIHMMMVFLTIWLVDSGTAMLAIAGFAALLLMLARPQSWLLRWLKPRNMLIFMALCTLVVVVVQQFGWISSLLSILFPNKTIGTMSARTFVWDAAVERIRENWLIGCGKSGFTAVGGWNVSHPHNFIMYQWISGGIGAVILTFILVYDSLKRMYARRSHFVSRVFLAAMLIIFVMGTVESLTEFPLLYALMSIGGKLAQIGDGTIDRPAERLIRAGSWEIVW